MSRNHRLLLLLLCLVCRPTLAQSRAPFYRVLVQGCADASSGQLTEQLALELRDRRPAWPVAAAIWLLVTCRGEDAELELLVPDSAPQPTGPLMPGIRARTLALKATELLDEIRRREASPVLAEPDPLPLEPEPLALEPEPLALEPAPPPLLRAKVVPRLGLRVAGTGAAGIFLQDGLTLGGGGLMLGVDAGKHVSFTLEALGQHGQTEAPGFQLDLDTLSAAAGVLFHQGGSVFHLRVGAGLRLGALRVTGTSTDAPESNDGASFVALLTMPVVMLQVAATPVRWLLVDLAAEGGYLVQPVQVLIADTPVRTLSGGVLGLRVGLGLSF